MNTVAYLVQLSALCFSLPPFPLQTVTIEQMNAEEVSNTFYCRTEYAAFKEAYRMHRDTSTGWCRSNDVLPCNCDACQDDLVEGVELMESPCGKEEEDYDSAFDEPEQPELNSSSHSIDDLEIVLHIEGGGATRMARITRTARIARMKHLSLRWVPCSKRQTRRAA